MENQTLVSVIIPTKNSSLFLSRALKSVKNQIYNNIEILIIDNNSKDKTKEIALTFTDKVYDKGPERSSQKNFGAKMAKGQYVLFLDSDAQLGQKVIKECVELAQKGYKMVIIPEKHLGQGFWAKAKALERQCFLGDDKIEAPWFFEKKSFLSVGGYDENMRAGEDWDLFLRMKNKGFRHKRSKSFIYHNLGKLELCSELKKKYYYAQNLPVFIKKNKRASLSKIPFLRRAYFRNWKLLLRHPLLSAGILFLKTTDVLFVLLSISVYKLIPKKR